jgi:hypothetical protein
MEEGIEVLNGDFFDESLIAIRGYLIHGIPVSDETQGAGTGGGAGSTADGGDNLFQAVDENVPPEFSEGCRDGFDAETPRAYHPGSKDGVGAHIGPNIDETVVLTKEMQQEPHVGEFVEAAVEIHGGSGHSFFDYQLGPSNPGDDDRRIQEPTPDLPLQEADDGACEIEGGERMLPPVTD